MDIYGATAMWLPGSKDNVIGTPIPDEHSERARHMQSLPQQSPSGLMEVI